MYEIQRHRQVDDEHRAMRKSRHPDFVFDTTTGYSSMRETDQMQTRALHQRKPDHTFVLQRQQPTNCDISSPLTESDNYVPVRTSESTDSPHYKTRHQRSDATSVRNTPSPRIQTAMDNLLIACELLQSQRENFTAGEVIVPMKAAGTDLYFVLQGTCYAYDQGIKIETIHEGEFFNELGLFYNMQNAYQYIAATDKCQIYKVSRKVIGTFLRESQFVGVLHIFNSKCEQRKLELRRRASRHPDTNAFRDATGIDGEKQQSGMQGRQHECANNRPRGRQDVPGYQSSLMRSRSTESTTSDDRGGLSVSSDQETLAWSAPSRTHNYRIDLELSPKIQANQRDDSCKSDVIGIDTHGGPHFTEKRLDHGVKRKLLERMHRQQEREWHRSNLSGVAQGGHVSRRSPSQVRRIRSESPDSYRGSNPLSEYDTIGMKSLSLNSSHGETRWAEREIEQDLEGSYSDPPYPVDHAPIESDADYDARSETHRHRSYLPSSRSEGSNESRDDLQRMYNTSSRSLNCSLTEENTYQITKPVIGREEYNSHGVRKAKSYPSRSSPYARAQTWRSTSSCDENLRLR